MYRIIKPNTICIAFALGLTMFPLSTVHAVTPSSSDSVTHPNIIYIYADDMGMGMLSAYGQQQFTTPNIDRLVQQGTSFSRAYGCMLSAPARASLLTGYHDCHGTDKWNISRGAAFSVSLSDTASIAKMEKEINAEDIRLPEGDFYLSQIFKKAGYTTAQIGNGALLLRASKCEIMVGIIIMVIWIMYVVMGFILLFYLIMGISFLLVETH